MRSNDGRARGLSLAAKGHNRGRWHECALLAERQGDGQERPTSPARHHLGDVTLASSVWARRERGARVVIATRPAGGVGSDAIAFDVATFAQAQTMIREVSVCTERNDTCLELAYQTNLRVGGRKR